MERFIAQKDVHCISATLNCEWPISQKCPKLLVPHGIPKTPKNLLVNVSYISGMLFPITPTHIPIWVWLKIGFPFFYGHLSSSQHLQVIIYHPVYHQFIIFLWPLITYLPTFHCHKIGDNKYPSSSDIPKPSNVPQQTWLKCKNDGIKHKFWCSYGP